MNKSTEVITQNKQNVDTQPLLQDIFEEAEQEYQQLKKGFDAMGWSDLPDRLKIEIKDDVAAMVDELEGAYSTCDPFVVKRRERVTYWVEMYQNHICSLNTVIDALKVRI